MEELAQQLDSIDFNVTMRVSEVTLEHSAPDRRPTLFLRRNQLATINKKHEQMLVAIQGKQWQETDRVENWLALKQMFEQGMEQASKISQQLLPKDLVYAGLKKIS